MRTGDFFRVQGALSKLTLVFVAAAWSCGGLEPGSDLVARRSALTTVTISGTVSDTSGLTLDGVTVTLSGSAQASTITDFTGQYSFSVNAGSYSVSASGVCTTFQPGVVNLNNVTTEATADFVGSGGACSAQTFAGATSGSFTISGTVTSGGHAVPGARVSLNGSTQGFRISDQAGAYSFSVNRGSYSISVSGGCGSFSPSVANLNNVTRNLVQNFVGSGNCPIAPLALCPVLDPPFIGSSLPASCNIVSTPDCALDRAVSWDTTFLLDFATALFFDCRFGNWFTGPGALSDADITTYVNDLVSFGLYLFGCPATGTQVGPLTFQLIPAAFASRTFSTADVQALSQLYSAAVAQALSEAGASPLTAGQINAINAQLAFLAGRVPGLVNSTTFTSSTCQ